MTAKTQNRLFTLIILLFPLIVFCAFLIFELTKKPK